MELSDFNNRYILKKITEDLVQYYNEYENLIITDFSGDVSENGESVKYEILLEDSLLLVSIINNGVRIKIIERHKENITIEYREIKLNN